MTPPAFWAVRPRRRGRTAHNALFALGAVALVAGGCSSGGDDVPAAPSSTAVTTAAASWTAWDPPCRETSNDTSEAPSITAAKFGPLGAAPGLVVRLPAGPGEGEGADRRPAVHPARTRDATVLGLSPNSGMFRSPLSMVVAIDDLGRVRWVQCVPGRVDGVWASTDEAATGVLVSSGGPRPSTGDERWWVLDAADGRRREVPLHNFTPVLDVAGQSDRHAFMVKGELGFEVRGLARYDLVEQEVEHLAVPSEATTTNSCGPRFGFGPKGDLLTFGPHPAAVWRDGEWVRDLEVVRAAAEPRMTFSCNDENQLEALDSTASVLWSRPDLGPAGLEGGGVWQDGGVAVLQACTGPPESCGQHDSLRTVAVDVRSGRTLWERDGFHPVSAMADGFVLMSEDDAVGESPNDPAWVLLDALTGAAIPGQRWPDRSAFTAGCCGDAEFFHVRRFGGVVIVTAGEEVRVWFPRDRTEPTRTVEVP